MTIEQATRAHINAMNDYGHGSIQERAARRVLKRIQAQAAK
jgi:hypothetical protein